MVQKLMMKKGNKIRPQKAKPKSEVRGGQAQKKTKKKHRKSGAGRGRVKRGGGDPRRWFVRPHLGKRTGQ